MLRIAIIMSAVLLAACQGRVTVDMATDAPADINIAQVSVTLTGVEYRKSDGGVERLTFRNGMTVDLVDYISGDPLRLFTNEDLPEGGYSGIRLLFDDDPSDDPVVIDLDGVSKPLNLATGDFADINFSVSESNNSSDLMTVTLDLRQSLSYDEDSDEYTLRPYVRSVLTDDDAGDITGSVSATCPTGSSLGQGGAVYLFKGQDVVPDDRDGIGLEPYATTDVFDNGQGQFTYFLGFIPEGRYTIALTCQGDLEDPEEDNELQFEAVDNVEVDNNETLIYDFGI